MFARKKKKSGSLLARLKNLKLSKRQEFVIITLFLTVFLIITQNLTSAYRFVFIIVLSLLSYGLCALGLREDLRKIEWLTLLILPTVYTISLGVFYFLLPVRWLTRIPFAILYGVGMYAILLVENIYNVAVNRSIQLLRVAHAVGFLISLVTVFLLINTIFTFHLRAALNFGLIFVIIFPLSLQALWAIKLTEESIGWDVFRLALFFSLLIAQAAFFISFWPLKPVLSSLFLSTSFYCLVGLGQQYLAKRLFRKNLMEFLQVFVIIFILIILTTSYRN